MTTRLSTRIFIKWGDENASEPTCTLVLSVGDYFMDSIVNKVDHSIDWAFAVTKETVSHNQLHCRWHHTIDSRQVFDPDEGIFENLLNGNDVEKATMHCPDRNGELRSYEEVWRQTEPAFGNRCAWILEGKLGEAITFLGKYGDLFLAMGQDTQDSFIVKKEELCEQPALVG